MIYEENNIHKDIDVKIKPYNYFIYLILTCTCSSCMLHSKTSELFSNVMNPIHVGQEAAVHTRPEKEIPDCRLCWSWKNAEIFENLPTKSRNYL